MELWDIYVWYDKAYPRDVVCNEALVRCFLMFDIWFVFE